MRNIVFAAAQFACSWDKRANIAKAKDMVRAAAAKGANAILIQ
jgi:N-carbamoylputrescine amidase